MLREVESEISTLQIVHHQIQVVLILKSIVHVDKMPVMQLRENLAFVDDGLY